MNFIFTLIILFVLSYILEIAVRKQFRVPKTVLSVTPVNKVHQKGKNIFLVLLLATLAVSLFTDLRTFPIFLLIIFLQYIFDIVMYAKYARETREHIVNIFFVIFYGLAAIVIFYFNPGILFM